MLTLAEFSHSSEVLAFEGLGCRGCHPFCTHAHAFSCVSFFHFHPLNVVNLQILWRETRISDYSPGGSTDVLQLWRRLMCNIDWDTHATAAVCSAGEQSAYIFTTVKYHNCWRSWVKHQWSNRTGHFVFLCANTDRRPLHALLPSSGAPLNRFRYLPQVSRDRWPVPGFIIVSNVWSIVDSLSKFDCISASLLLPLTAATSYVLSVSLLSTRSLRTMITQLPVYREPCTVGISQRHFMPVTSFLLTALSKLGPWIYQ